MKPRGYVYVRYRSATQCITSPECVILTFFWEETISTYLGLVALETNIKTPGMHWKVSHGLQRGYCTNNGCNIGQHERRLINGEKKTRTCFKLDNLYDINSQGFYDQTSDIKQIILSQQMRSNILLISCKTASVTITLRIFLHKRHCVVCYSPTNEFFNTKAIAFGEALFVHVSDRIVLGTYNTHLIRLLIAMSSRNLAKHIPLKTVICDVACVPCSFSTKTRSIHTLSSLCQTQYTISPTLITYVGDPRLLGIKGLPWFGG